MGKSSKEWKHHCFYLKKLMEKLGNSNLECYIRRARAIVIEVRSFERIAYLVFDQSLRHKHKNLVRRGRERGAGGVREG